MAYTPESRAKAVRLYRLRDRGLKDGLTSDERAELTRLRRENRLLLEEKDILRKATLLRPITAQ